MKIVTSGAAYLDIDAFASCVADAELLNLQGEQAIAASSAPLNESITGSLRRLGKTLTTYAAAEGDQFILVDISAEKYFDPIVANGEVVEIIDHHPGDETYWQEKLGDKAQIEPVGAACTQVFERWEQAGKSGQMDAATATLLAAGILDNTLNFTAEITKDRDHAAYGALKEIGGLSDDFPAQYFSECQEAIEADIVTAVKNDAKELDKDPGMPRFMGQVVVWDAAKILRDKLEQIKDTMAAFGEDWGLNLISISEDKSFLLAVNPAPQQKFTKLFGVNFENGVSNPISMKLRKEILKAAQDQSASF